ncbi:hypothetical protein [Streptomyces sp. NBC_01481]|uniref:hypothetical protein n=1 Tax=Streptomyces sp. NBC_01481 TaxID=2975869 RepID=UPI0022574FA1|nr:hypothetical protein [Streptomyces sp. NBC_01481]MCX4587136.1 hypothetical protein [Streptomyces sp. NBC_01481]
MNRATECPPAAMSESYRAGFTGGEDSARHMPRILRRPAGRPAGLRAEVAAEHGARQAAAGGQGPGRLFGRDRRERGDP